MPRSTYYYYVKQMKKPDKYAAIKEQIRAIYHENQGRYGYRRITMELHNRGHQINHKTVQRLMKTLHLKCMVRVKKYRSYKGETGKIAPNILERGFQRNSPEPKMDDRHHRICHVWNKAVPLPHFGYVQWRNHQLRNQ